MGPDVHKVMESPKPHWSAAELASNGEATAAGSGPAAAARGPNRLRKRWRSHSKRRSGGNTQGPHSGKKPWRSSSSKTCFSEYDPNIEKVPKHPNDHIYDESKGYRPWEIYKTPSKAFCCSAWFGACKHDLFCGKGECTAKASMPCVVTCQSIHPTIWALTRLTVIFLGFLTTDLAGGKLPQWGRGCMSPPDPKGVCGKGAPLSQVLILAFFGKNILQFFFHQKGGQMTFFLTPFDALISKMPFSFFLGFWPPCWSHADRLPL